MPRALPGDAASIALLLVHLKNGADGSPRANDDERFAQTLERRKRQRAAIDRVGSLALAAAGACSCKLRRSKQRNDRFSSSCFRWSRTTT